MQITMSQRDLMFRKFQIRKFSRKNMVPAVTMTVNVDASQILKLKEHLNNRDNNNPHITITHIITKAVADTLVQYPILYSFFNGNEIIENKELILNIPVDVESHVEYITIHRPESKTIDEISREFYKELTHINSGNGTYMKFLLQLNEMSLFRKIMYFCGSEGKIRFLREHYGIFPISNFGSFHVNSGTLTISQPLVAALCIGAIDNERDHSFIPLTLTFDHRPVDGAYAGKFLHNVRTLLEMPDLILKEGW
ncbi:2-oxo acid dehydrogenase subunit E2 [Anaerocolumna sp. MB42-C2]|uniref:2-oxo acid dehydrogenase subunit E2 n=1 Tax=Anaerocolumna sp. MB42-C2 TaxID=3070997 RepID=UPI0027E043A0|nr:2-oxo acid dehydrogenase subunit E2 [Anaerocolumna sp. MB42-C2]WMJ86891.1 2-oxo acid dehydrogenase subunit E2 [Anaerocolumna sp. MB42-C2]